MCALQATTIVKKQKQVYLLQQLKKPLTNETKKEKKMSLSEINEKYEIKYKKQVLLLIITKNRLTSSLKFPK